MSDLISREDLLKRMEMKYQYSRKRYPNTMAQGFLQMENLIKKQPTIEAVPVAATSIDSSVMFVEAVWLKEMGAFFPRYICSACGVKHGAEWYRYCPSCGAKMKGGAE